MKADAMRETDWEEIQSQREEDARKAAEAGVKEAERRSELMRNALVIAPLGGARAPR